MTTGIEILDKYTAYYTQKFAKEGLNIDKDEIAGELGLAYAEALKNYDPENDGQVKFSTYVIRAFKNSMYDLKKEHIKWNFGTVAMDDLSKIDNCLYTACESENKLTIQDDKREIMESLKGRELIIFNEMVNTSAKVLKVIEAINYMHKGAPQRYIIAKGGGVFVLAINLVYGYSKGNIRHNIRNIRKKTRKVLDFAA